MLGIFYAIIASAFFALNGATVRRGMVYGSAWHGLNVSILGGVPLFVIASLVTGQLFLYRALGLSSYGMLVIVGLLHFLVGRYASFKAISILGQTKSQPLSATSLLISVVFAMFWLNETITGVMAIGIILLLVGPTIIASPVSSNKEEKVLNNENVILGYAWGTVNALCWGVTPVMIRDALDGTGLGILGGTVSYSAAAIVLIFLMLVRINPSIFDQLQGRSGRWFTAGAITVFAAQMFRFLALSAAPVSLVMPLMRAGAIFVVLFAFIINREYESFEGKVLLGIALSIMGAVAMVL